jgi:hypothetical protein
MPGTSKNVTEHLEPSHSDGSRLTEYKSRTLKSLALMSVRRISRRRRRVFGNREVASLRQSIRTRLISGRDLTPVGVFRRRAGRCSGLGAAGCQHCCRNNCEYSRDGSKAFIHCTLHFGSRQPKRNRALMFPIDAVRRLVVPAVMVIPVWTKRKN